MKLWTYSIIRNERQILPWFVRHYSTFAEKMIFYDDKSDDGTVEFLKSQPKCEVRKWPHSTGLDDEKFIEFFNSVPAKEASGAADLVAVVDADELLYSPFITDVLKNANGNMIPATGYALINPAGWPKDDGKSQIYELIKTGAPQENYNKRILFRPSSNPRFAHGRHFYPGNDGWPKYIGTESPDYGVKLFHLHHVGAVPDTLKRNQNNYDRAHNKKFAWNYTPEHNFNPAQVGSVAWVEKLIAENKLADVVGDMPSKTVPSSLRKIQLGSGGLNIPNFENFDLNVDLRKPLPFKDNSCSHIVMSHCLEHITIKEAWNCLEECKRSMADGGIIRIAIPDLSKLSRDCTQEYNDAVRKGGHGDGTKKASLKSMVFNHGHLAAWNAELMITFLSAVGFTSVRQCEYGKSVDSNLNGCDLHGKTVGDAVAKVETSCVEAVK